jgi:hypothetical protein
VVRGKENLKILAVGNSFSQDSLRYVYDIAKDLGAQNVTLVNLYIGGCSLALHKSNAENDLPNYDYEKNTDGVWRTDGKISIKTAVESDNWDVITLQQASGSSGMPDTYGADLNYLLEYICSIKPQKTVVAWNMTWAYAQNSTHAEFSKYHSNQTEMYGAITGTVREKVAPKENFELIIPAGTAVQNARSGFIGDNLTRDGYHLNDLGRYLAALTWVKAVTGWDVGAVKTFPPTLEIDAYSLNALTDAVESALKTPYAVTQSTFTEAPPVIMPDLSEHRQIDWLPFGGAYWQSADDNYDKLITQAANSKSFVASFIRFTKEQLPSDSYIILQSGWQYRAEGWVGDAKNEPASRPGLTGKSVTRVTDLWWGSFTLRAFNVSKTDNSALDTNSEYVLARDALKIYVPNTAPSAYDPPSTDDSAAFAAQSLDVSDFDRMDLMPIFGFYNKPEGFDIINTNAALSPQFVATKIFTRDELPVGSVLIVDGGYQYRPVWWTEAKTYTTRPNNVTAPFTVITDEWWNSAEHRYKGFNVSLAPTAQISDPYAAMSHFRIYVPKNIAD